MAAHFILRDDQTFLKNGLYSAWNQGKKNVLIVQPTGGGKSVIMSDICLDIHNMNRSFALMAHRNELVSQLSGHIAGRGIYHRIIGDTSIIKSIRDEHFEKFGRSYINPDAPHGVIGVDTLKARGDKLLPFTEQIEYIKTDEGHHVLPQNKWGTSLEMFTRALAAGYTATPKRADGRALGREFGGVYDDMIVGAQVRQLIDIKALSDYEIVCPTSDLEVDEKKVDKEGDLTRNELKKAAKNSHIVGDTTAAYLRFAKGRKAIVFATDVETAGEMGKSFKAAGIAAAMVSGKTDRTVRKKYIKDFKSGEILVLINVDLFDEGFDVPDCDVVIMARPTMSLAKYRQMVGRCLRFVEGKVALIIDQVSNIKRHRYPDKVVEWTLGQYVRKKERDPEEIPHRACVYCTRPYERILSICPHCGLMPPLPEPKDRTIDVVEGELILLDRATLAAMRANTYCEPPASVAQRVQDAAGRTAGMRAFDNQVAKIAAQERVKQAIAEWGGIQRHIKGLTDSQIQRKFYHAMGVDMVTALDARQNATDFNNIAERIEGWYK